MKKKSLKFIPNPIELTKNSNPNNYFDKVGRKSGILGFEDGSFEFWCYPYKICRNFSLSFLLESSTIPIRPELITKSISNSPEKTTITFSYQSFTVKESFITPLYEPAALVLLDIETVEPIKIVASFIPEMQPMWPAGLGGQLSFWSKESSAFIITESTKKHNAYIGSPNAVNLSNPPAHMLSDYPNQFIIEATPESCKDNIFIIGLAGGQLDREVVQKIYNNILNNPMKYYTECQDYYSELRTNTMNVITPDQKINLAFEWGKIAFDSMLIENPQLGKGLIAGLGSAGKSGRPGFGWFFAGDASLNSFAILGYGEFKTIKESITFIQKFQREDGKIAHEVSQSAKLINWFGDYPYAYIHADTTCFYLISIYEYMIASGDTDFIKENWNSILKAYNWCLSTDENNDGLMDNTKAGLGAFEIPPFTNVLTDIYLSAAYAMALFGLSEMAKAVGKSHSEYLDKYKIAVNKINEKFWDEKNKYFSFAINKDETLIMEMTSFCAVPMIWKLLDEEKALMALEKINSADLQTDWGTRSMSSKSSYYDPLNYNYGAVWPFMSCFPALANYKYRNPNQGFSILRNIIEHVYDNAVGYCHEVFSGNTNRHLEESVPHQAFSTLGYMLPFIKGTLGLTSNAIKRELEFSPQIPPNWEYLEIRNFRSGDNHFDFLLEKGINIVDEMENRNEILGIHFDIRGPEQYKIKINLAYPPLTKIYKVIIGNNELEYKIEKCDKYWLVSFEITGIQQGTIIIEHDRIIGIVPYECYSEIGSCNQGLKIIKEGDNINVKTLIVEGLTGQKYFLEIINNDLITNVEGAEITEGGILIDFPESDYDEFIRKEIKIFND